jgi:hypothetical protein
MLMAGDTEAGSGFRVDPDRPRKELARIAGMPKVRDHHKRAFGQSRHA